MRTGRPVIDLLSARCSLGWRPSPAPATRLLRIFTNHETRDTKHGFYVFHESRVANHESRPFSRRKPGETLKAISGRAGCGLPEAPKPPRVAAPAAQLLLACTCSRGIARRGNIVAQSLLLCLLVFPIVCSLLFAIVRHYFWEEGGDPEPADRSARTTAPAGRSRLAYPPFPVMSHDYPVKNGP